MPVEADANQLMLGRGKIYFDRFDDTGSSTGLRFVGEADKFDINPSVTTKDYFTMTKAQRTKLALNNDTQTHEIDVQFREYQKENLALALLGESVAFSQTTSTVTTETLSATAKPGMIYQTAKRGISALIIPTGGDGVIGTDIELLDGNLGLIHVLPGSEVFDGSTPLVVGYTAAAVNSFRVKAGTTATIEGKLIFVGDPAEGPAVDVEVWRVRFSPSAALSLLNDDYASIALKGEALDDTVNHPDDPLYHVTYR